MRDGSSVPANAREDRLDSWKEIAAFLKRDVTTVQRWEKREGMPVHRHQHDKVGSVYALRSELDAWMRSRSLAGSTTNAATTFPGRRLVAVVSVVAAGVVVAGLIVWRMEARDVFWRNPIANATMVQVTEVGGTEPAVALSRDGKFAAFLANRDGQVDVWVTQVGTGQFHNATRGVGWELVNPSVRTLGFSPDGALVTFWTRKPGARGTDIGMWTVPILGGEPRPYLEGAAEFDWSGDSSRLVYHTPGPGDPMFVRDAAAAAESRQIFAAPSGLHSHFLLWSMDQTFIYFVQGSLPDRMDIWRTRPTGGVPERITHHDTRVSYPIFVNPRTLLYLATDSSGSGPWLYGVDVERRIPHRVSSGIDAFTSLAASGDGGRLVATRSTTGTTLWHLTNNGGTSAPSRLTLSTDTGSRPRLGPGYLLYVSSRAESDSLWKQQGGAATELWTAPRARILGAPAVTANGDRIAFAVKQAEQPYLYVMNADGTDARIVARSLEWQGTPAWAADGRTITAAALDGGVPRLFTVSLDGGAPVPLGRDRGLEPAWSPDGRFVVFSGADIGTTFPVRAMTADGKPHALPNLTLTRGARHLRFFMEHRTLVFLKGEIRHKNLWSVDLDTGSEHQLTNLPPDFDVRDFDLSPDGREIVLERAEAHSEIVLLELSR